MKSWVKILVGLLLHFILISNSVLNADAETISQAHVETLTYKNVETTGSYSLVKYGPKLYANRFSSQTPISSGVLNPHPVDIRRDLKKTTSNGIDVTLPAGKYGQVPRFDHSTSNWDWAMGRKLMGLAQYNSRNGLDPLIWWQWENGPLVPITLAEAGLPGTLNSAGELGMAIRNKAFQQGCPDIAAFGVYNSSYTLHQLAVIKGILSDKFVVSQPGATVTVRDVTNSDNNEILPDYPKIDITVDVTTYSLVGSPPLVRADNVNLYVDHFASPGVYLTGIDASYRSDPNKKIPPNGHILIDGVDANASDPYFDSGVGGQILHIGRKSQTVTAVDNSGSADPAWDTASTSRVITSTTGHAPGISATLPKNLPNPQGEQLTEDVPYNPIGPNPGGGNFGWTKYYVKVHGDSTHITGEYDYVQRFRDAVGGGGRPGSVTDATTYVNTHQGRPGAVSDQLLTDEAPFPTHGWAVDLVCTAAGDPATPLSAVSTMEIRIDTTRPTAALAKDGGGSLVTGPDGRYQHACTDDLSGVRAVAILFAPVGSPAPPPTSKSWQDINGYTVPTDASHYDLYVCATDQAGNQDIRLAQGNVKVHDTVEASLDTDQGATVHVPGCPNALRAVTAAGCDAACHAGARRSLEEGTLLKYAYTLRSTGGDARGTFTSYLPKGVEVPSGSGLTVTSPTGQGSSVTGTFTPGTGAHVGQTRVDGAYTLKAADSPTLTFELACRAPLFDHAPGADQAFAHAGGTVSFTMDDGYAATTALNSAVHEAAPLPNRELSLSKTVAGKYGNRDKAFGFRLEAEHAWGAPLEGSYPYTGPDGSSGQVAIEGGVLAGVDGTAGDQVLLKHGQALRLQLPQGCRFRITEQALPGYVTTETVDGVPYPHSAPGVVEGALGPAGAAVAYRNDRPSLPLTGIAGPGAGSDTLLALLAGAVLLSGAYASGRSRRRGRKGSGPGGAACLLALALAWALPSGGGMAQASGMPGTPGVVEVEQSFQVEDGTPATRQFAYRMVPATPGAPLPGGAAGAYAFQLTGDEALALPAIPFPAPGTYVYEVCRAPGGELDGYAYDGAAWTVEATVRAGPGGLEPDYVMKDPAGYKCPKIAFVHRYRPLASDPSLLADPPVRKQVEGSPGQDGRFQFRLTAEREAYPMPEGSREGSKVLTITGEGEAEFGTWSYAKTGTYRYAVEEVEGGEAGYTYDGTAYTITDVVTDQSGRLSVRRTVEDGRGNAVQALAFTNRYQEPGGGAPGGGAPGGGAMGGDTPGGGAWSLLKTGDAAPLLPWLAAAAGSGMAALLLWRRRRRRKQAGRREAGE